MTQGSIDAGFIPALRFDALTPLFDIAVAATAREGTLKRGVLAHAAIQPGDDVLDVGCGTGTLVVAAARREPLAQFTGLDADPSVLARARQKAAATRFDIAFDEGRADALPYADGSFDVVLSTLFFHHLPDAVKHATAAELARVLRPGGRLVVGDLGRPQDPVMRVAVRATVQLLDGLATTALNVRGELPGVLGAAGFAPVTVVERLRTPIGTIDTIVARRQVTTAAPRRSRPAARASPARGR